MQTNIVDKYKDDSRISEAESILRRCVHCGFCLATCPTYNLLGDELDSPRGRIYLIKQVLEGQTPSTATQQHLDRCLSCRNCETTCPSGVAYGQLIDIGRDVVAAEVPRSLPVRLARQLVLKVLPFPKRIGPLVSLGQNFAVVLPKALRRKIPVRRGAGILPMRTHDRKMLIVQGCVQPSMAPATNAAAGRVLDKLGIELISAGDAGCCGAIPFHLQERSNALDMMRSNIDAWWPYLEDGAEAIINTASGCGLMIKEYAEALKDDPDYRDKAKKVSELACDLSELLAREDLSELINLTATLTKQKVAFHPPCTLQHGQKLNGVCETLLAQFGFELTQVPDAHTCCGSAGTYSIFQPQLSSQLQHNKATALLSGTPDVIATANIGCQLHIQSAVKLDVKHWIELLDELLAK